MWQDILFGAGGVLTVVLTVLLSWAARKLVPIIMDWLTKKKILEELRIDESKLYDLEKAIAAAVRLAEKDMADKPGAEKFKWVYGILSVVYEDVVAPEILAGMIEKKVDELKGTPVALQRTESTAA